MGEDGLVVLREDGRSLGRAPAGAGEQRCTVLPQDPHKAGPVLCSQTGAVKSSTHRQGRKLWGRHRKPPNPAMNPQSLQSQYLKQTIAMITTTMTNSSPAVAEPTIRGSSWKVLLVEPDGGRGRNQHQVGSGAHTGGLQDGGSPVLVPTILRSCLKLRGEAVAAVSSHRARPDLYHIPSIGLQPVQPH